MKFFAKSNAPPVKVASPVLTDNEESQEIVFNNHEEIADEVSIDDDIDDEVKPLPKSSSSLAKDSMGAGATVMIGSVIPNPRIVPSFNAGTKVGGFSSMPM